MLKPGRAVSATCIWPSPFVRALMSPVGSRLVGAFFLSTGAGNFFGIFFILVSLVASEVLEDWVLLSVESLSSSLLLSMSSSSLSSSSSS